MDSWKRRALLEIADGKLQDLIEVVSEHLPTMFEHPPCDQATVRLSEDPTALPEQEKLQDQCAGSFNESIPGPASDARYSLSNGIV